LIYFEDNEANKKFKELEKLEAKKSKSYRLTPEEKE
jgi:hypothetical protein